MKRSGLKAETAAAIESVASSGGQIMPPLMGAAALLMASFLGVSFFDIIVVGVLPALIFYVSVIIAVHATASNELEISSEDIVLTEVVDGELRDIDSLLIEVIRFGLPIVVLLVMLGPMGYTITMTALVTALVMIATGVGFPLLLTRSTDAIRTGAAETIAETGEDGVRFVDEADDATLRDFFGACGRNAGSAGMVAGGMPVGSGATSASTAL